MGRGRKKTNKSRTENKAKGSRKSKVRKRTWDPVEVAEKLAPAVATLLGLDSLGFTEDQLVEILRDLLVMIIGDRVTKPKAETLVNSILRNRSKAYAYIAAKILEVIPEGKLTPEQLEFVVNNINELVIPHAPRLYKEMKRLGLDLTSSLQIAWEKAWHSRGDEGPVGYCPYCGLRSIDPTGTCMVCGRVLNDKELRIATDFSAKFREFVETASCAEIDRALNEAVLYVDHYKVSTTPSSKWAIEIVLNKSELSLLKKFKEEKCVKDNFKKVLREVVSKL